MRRYQILLIAFVLLAALIFFFGIVPARVSQLYGPPAYALSLSQRVQFSMRLFRHNGLLTEPADPNGPAMRFTVAPGESVTDVAARLRQLGLIRNANAFRDYLIYTGLDTSIQAGNYELSAALSTIDIARAMQDATPLEVDFGILPGWRMEEIAASLPTSGLSAAPDEFLASARNPLNFDFLGDAITNEGFFLPGTYILPRATDADGLVEALVRNFAQHLNSDLADGFANQNLTVYQAVILASLVERESIQTDEMPLIASVFINRLDAGWKLDSDPTIQYALGYEGNWWPNPLSALDLEIDSPYNTYLVTGLPPAPIANPSLEALSAVSHPADTGYFFFRARCDGSGYHNFAVTLEEHIANGCE
jgi:UPF0755 protein